MYFPVGSTVAVLRGNDGPWMDGVNVKGNSADHNGWSYK